MNRNEENNTEHQLNLDLIFCLPPSTPKKEKDNPINKIRNE